MPPGASKPRIAPPYVAHTTPPRRNSGDAGAAGRDHGCVPIPPPAPSRPLPGGLLLRAAEPADLQQIGDLLVDRGEDVDRLDHRLVVEDDDPDHGWAACAVVVDGDRVVSTATLLREEVVLADHGATVRMPAGQVELVATERDYERRGLVRELMRWAHGTSQVRGDVLQVMIGIPYFYRLFGYSYAVDIAARRPLVRQVDAPAGLDVRAATAADLPALTALQDAAQAVAQVRMPHSPARRRWLLAHEGSTTWVVERDGRVVGAGRTTPPDDGLMLAEVAAVDATAATAVVAHAQSLAGGGRVRVAVRPGTALDGVLAAAAGPPPPDAEQYYVRVPSVPALLDAVRPVLSARLAASGLDGDEGRDLVVSTYGAHVRLPMTENGLGAAVEGGPMHGPWAAGGCGVAPDQVGSLLLGPLGIEGLARRQPDVYPGPGREWFAALFPPVSSDLLTYYLP